MEKEEGPVRTIHEAVEIRVWSRVEREDGTIVSKHRLLHNLDPNQFTMTQQRQMDTSTGEPVPVGNPYLVLHGVLIAAQQDPITLEEDQELDIQMEKVANLVTIKATWAGEKVLDYELTEQMLMTEEMKHHVALITERIRTKVGKDKVSESVVKELLGKAAQQHVAPPAPPEAPSLVTPLFPRRS
jgi:hypothetical protein